MDKHILELTPQELNSFLIEKYGFGLHPFASILFFHFGSGDYGKSYQWPSKQECLETKRKLQNLKRKLIDIIIDYEEFRGNIGIRKWFEIDKKHIENTLSYDYKLVSFFKIIDKEINLISYLIKIKRKGSTIKITNLITSSWALLMQENNYDKDWELIADLLDWFWEIFKSYDNFKNLNPKDKIADPEYLKNQFLRNKKRKIFLFDLLKKNLNIKNWNRLPFTVVFHENVSFVIHHSRLPKIYVDIHSQGEKKVQVLEAILSKRIIDPQKMPFQWESLALEYYVSKICKINPNSPPLILFPDLSHL